MKTQEMIVNTALEYYTKWQELQCVENKNIITCKNGSIKFVNWKDGTPWCAAFVSHVLEDVRLKYNVNFKIKPTSSTRSLREQGGTYYRVDKTAKPGAIFYKKYANDYCSKLGNNKGCGHVGIVLEIKDGNIKIIEGNTGDKIKISTLALSVFNAKSPTLPNGVEYIHVEEEANNYKDDKTKYINYNDRNYYLELNR